MPIKLSYDVLACIFKGLDSKADLVSVMQTCRMLYQAGIPVLLEDVVVIQEKHSLMSFCSFMLADVPRFRHLRSLSLASWHAELPWNELLALTLAKVLRLSQRLETLAINNSKFLDAYPAVCDAILSIKTLKTLSLMHGECISDDNLSGLLHSMPLPVPNLSVSLKDSWTSMNAGKTLEVLEPASQYLEQLCMCFAIFPSLDDTSTYRFPRLKILILQMSCKCPSVRTIVQAFPNLRHLEFHDSPWSTWDDVLGRRVENVAVQQHLRWPLLTYLQGHLTALYGLALQCPITTLRTDVSFDMFIERDQSDMLLDVVRDATPQNLWFSMEDVFLYQNLGTALRSASTQLTRLVLEVWMSTSGPNPQERFNCIFDALISSKANLIYLSLRIEGYLSDFEQDVVVEDTNNLPDHNAEGQIESLVEDNFIPPLHPTLQALQQLDHLECARRISEAVGTIEVIVLAWDRGDTVPYQFVAVIEPLNRSLRVLSEREGAMLIEEMEKCWSPIQKLET